MALVHHALNRPLQSREPGRVLIEHHNADALARLEVSIREVVSINVCVLTAQVVLRLTTDTVFPGRVSNRAAFEMVRELVCGGVGG